MIVAKDGADGLALHAREHPDLVILDIMLPGGMNGFDVLEKLKKDDALKKIPVFVITNLESEEKVARQIGAVDYAVKVHIDPHELVDKIRKILH